MPHHVIIFPGLGNGITLLTLAVKRWRRYGLTPHVLDARWTVEEPDFDRKLHRAIAYIDALTAKGAKISLIGNSAGSSYALNCFGKRSRNIHALVINGGRIRSGDWPWFTFDMAASTSPSFRTSVLMAEEVERKLTVRDRHKILTLRPWFDEIVPPFTVPIRGATNVVVPAVGHVPGIAASLTVLDQTIIEFISGER